MAKAQVGIDSLVAVAAFLAFLAVLASVAGHFSSDGRAAMHGVDAQAKADALALALDFRGMDAAYSSLGGVRAPDGCGLMQVNGSVVCVNGSASGSARIIVGTTGWNGYGGFNRIPV